MLNTIPCLQIYWGYTQIRLAHLLDNGVLGYQTGDTVSLWGVWGHIIRCWRMETKLPLNYINLFEGVGLKILVVQHSCNYNVYSYLSVWNFVLYRHLVESKKRLHIETKRRQYEDH